MAYYSNYASYSGYDYEYAGPYSNDGIYGFRNYSTIYYLTYYGGYSSYPNYGYGYPGYGYGEYTYSGVPSYIVGHYTSIRFGYGYYEAGTRLVDGVDVTYAYYIDRYGYAYQTYYGSGYYSDVPLYNVGALYSSEYGKFDPFPSSPSSYS